MPNAIQQLEQDLAKVREQLGEYDDLRAQEQRYSEALAILKGETPRAARRGVRRPRGSVPTIDPDEVIRAIHVLAEPEGSSASSIREHLGLAQEDSNRLSIALKSLVDEGRLEKRGERRATRYLAK